MVKDLNDPTNVDTVPAMLTEGLQCCSHPVPSGSLPDAAVAHGYSSVR